MVRSAPRLRALLVLGLALGLAALVAVDTTVPGVARGPAHKASLPSCPGAKKRPTKATVAQAQEVTMCLINRRRIRRGRSPLRMSPDLTASASAHSRDMVRRDYFNHDSPGGRSVADRVLSTGWASRRDPWKIGENIAFGNGRYSSPMSTVKQWMASKGHRQNILSRSFREAGVGIAVGSPAGGTRGVTYTVDFGKRG